MWDAGRPHGSCGCGFVLAVVLPVALVSQDHQQKQQQPQEPQLSRGGAEGSERSQGNSERRGAGEAASHNRHAVQGSEREGGVGATDRQFCPTLAMWVRIFFGAAAGLFHPDPGPCGCCVAHSSPFDRTLQAASLLRFEGAN